MSDNDASSSVTSPAEHEAARGRLLAERAEAVARITALGRDFAEIVAANALVAVDDEHDPEGSSTAFERAHVASLLAQGQRRLAELECALERLERGEYGLCEGCGRPIPADRLEVRPAARTCVTCAATRPR
ncbi:TraR/DksA C4-type zinc finger protein [Streptacidiphilus sp. P02-A3a]|uniref:TraR/DksA family transcriptional regulator n=1 Tax=Streptacidiphilus sp. P02-A3a TaxID=2704468 RepID=UPI0015FB72FF|nr:TraR/DksA C4-type zinc finger protein [Streptacidiphilus sp. P02-A3a]QMU73194.1 TraR/DksA family transcriptional regulator [Streptacidiphilus sp. P02-A3a]